MTVPESNVTIESGYRPGLLARCLEMHIAYYHPYNSWGLTFETSLAKSWADLIQRLTNPRNQIFAAIQSTPNDNPADFTQKIVGTILIDAEHLQQPNTAQIRGFIVDERARGLGVGKRLMAAAMEFIQQQKFDKVTLFTSNTQEASLYLYKKAGFVVVKDEQKILWDVPMNELQLDWTRPVVSTPGVDDQGVNGFAENDL
ncbi:putative HTH-type DNA-binding domain-containing acetyltransferase YbfA [Fusarium oxysporum f. sp. rapae]|uniref:Putative HTH-type DNA-binding domain-containing acetyltransferase YbfA n=1 Tax=Fusarium oxysporum f. sp. rapae TaxID=485398 RepID=A0A8J5NQE0_FUSOX|nr:putative HTH-type DNA-binding domain-containing acetyltransferase YbfA [Fusarium oxysporum f. sp. rapae]